MQALETNWADDLISQYSLGRQDLARMKRELEDEASNLVKDKEAEEIDYDTRVQLKSIEQDKSLINSMISDMDYSLEWMRRGRRPESRRGVDRRAAYQRRVLMDMDLFPLIEEVAEEEPEVQITEEKKKQILDALIELSDRERHCYLLHMANGMTISQIKAELGVGRSTVQTYINRAKQKINKIF